MARLEPLLTSTAGDISNIILTKLLKITDSSTKGIFGPRQHDISFKQSIYTASLKYISNYTHRHGLLKVLGMQEPVSLDSIYIKVNFLSGGILRSFASIDELEKKYRQSNVRSFALDDRPRISGMKVANQDQYLMVLGLPGSGKSTFLRKIGLEALKRKRGEYLHNCIPVFLELKQFRSSDVCIRSLIVSEFEACGFPQPEKVANQALKQGRLLVLLDALNEVPPEYFNLVTQEINDFVDRYSRNRFIVSSRTAAYKAGLPRFIDVEISHFDDGQICQFIDNWFRSEDDVQRGTAAHFWELLRKKENIAMLELAQAPLLLTFLCLVYERAQALPANRNAIYRKAFNILLEEWAAEKRSQWETILEGLHPELEKILLSEIAYQGFKEDRLFFSQQEIIRQITNFLAKNLNASAFLNGRFLLNEIEVQQGILVERAEQIYTFSHLTIQEYLTASYITDQQIIEDFVSENLLDNRWHEVFLLIAGQAYGGADKLLLCMEKLTRQCINTPRLRDLLHWTVQVTSQSDSVEGAVAKRAAAIYLVCTFAFSSRSALDSICSATLNLAQNFDLEAMHHIYSTRFHTNPGAYVSNIARLKIFKSLNYRTLITDLESLHAEASAQQQVSEIPQYFEKSRQRIWLDAFQLELDLVDLSDNELVSLTQYFRSYLLIIQCKSTAIRVLPRTWRAILERMLVPEEDI
ncbi:MAG: NACHT domain-containing protein [Cyanobacteria bacterium J06649_11]